MLRYPRIILGFPSITLALSKQYSYRKALRASREADRKASAHRRAGRKGRPASWKAGRKASGCLGRRVGRPPGVSEGGSEGPRASRKAGWKASGRLGRRIGSPPGVGRRVGRLPSVSEGESEGHWASRKAGQKASRRPREAAQRTILVKLVSFTVEVVILYYRTTSPPVSRVMLIRFTMHVSLALLTKREETPNEQNEPSTVIELVIEIARSNLPLFYRRSSRPTNRNGSGVPTFRQAFADLDWHQNNAHFICFFNRNAATVCSAFFGTHSGHPEEVPGVPPHSQHHVFRTRSGARWVSISRPEKVQSVPPHSRHCVFPHALRRELSHHLPFGGLAK